MNKVKLYTEESKLDFGKYSGKLLTELIKINPSYLKWCVKNVSWFVIPDSILQILFEGIPSKENRSIFLVAEPIDSYKRINDVKLSVWYTQNANRHNRFDDSDVYNEEFMYPKDHWLIDAAGTDDPEVMNDVYWNID